MEETFEQMQARHRKELRDLQGRITNKKKNATKKTRKFVNDECAELERQTKERHEEELRRLMGDADEPNGVDGQPLDDRERPQPGPRDEEDQDQALVNNLADRLESTTTLAPRQQQTQSQTQQEQAQAQTQQQQQQPPPQEQKPKRNRQKERLARRQAEQEAAARAAESEAAGMTDHRAAERQAMRRAFAAHALREREIAPDGHCLFSAVADQLEALDIPLSPKHDLKGKEGNGEEGLVDVVGERAKVAPYRVVRRAAAEWIKAHREEYEGFIHEEEGGVDKYVQKIRDTAEWGGQLELAALANAYGVEIRVVQGGERVEVIRPAAGAVVDGQEGEENRKGEEGRRTIWLAYYRHGYGLGEHYNSLRRTTG
ncbi:cysteine proteinase [Parathielavia appendiculata]|uniref:Cysteine proteinase n=1 Tax=Parathielavia appendiculata TaxID=2587402 RepID=A0AAN6TV75_9PEZI|nr:cysteine proteinase [Parathielavia appendiculata]